MRDEGCSIQETQILRRDKSWLTRSNINLCNDARYLLPIAKLGDYKGSYEDFDSEHSIHNEADLYLRESLKVSPLGHSPWGKAGLDEIVNLCEDFPFLEIEYFDEDGNVVDPSEDTIWELYQNNVAITELKKAKTKAQKLSLIQSARESMFRFLDNL